MTVAGVIQQQHLWAGRQRPPIQLYPNDRVMQLADNFVEPLPPDIINSYAHGQGREIVYYPGTHSVWCEKSKLCSLHSSAALVVNFFLHWRANVARLGHMAELMGAAPGMQEMAFEAVHHTGVPRSVAHLDLEFRGPGLRPLAVESKYGELFDPRSSCFKSAHFAPRVWAGLPRSESLASGLYAGTASFELLDAPQLLKHILGLSRAYGVGGFRLVHLYYDYFGQDNASRQQYETECTRFAQAVSGEVDFAHLTYQDLFACLRQSTPPSVTHDPYFAYLAGRYFP